MTGPAAGAALLLASLVHLPACGDDDGGTPAEPAAVGGPVELPDASVRALPGDGLEPTPEFDIETRDREPLGPQRVVEAIDALRNGGPRDAGAADTPDPGNPGDAGVVNGTN